MKNFVFILTAILSIQVATAQFTAQISVGKSTSNTFDTYNAVQTNVGEPITYNIAVGSQILPGLSLLGSFQKDAEFRGTDGRYKQNNAVIDFTRSVESFMVGVELNPMLHAKIGPIFGFGVGQAVARQASIIMVVDTTYPGIPMLYQFCPFSDELKTAVYSATMGFRLTLSDNYFFTTKITKKWFGTDKRDIIETNNDNIIFTTIGIGVEL